MAVVITIDIDATIDEYDPQRGGRPGGRSAGRAGLHTGSQHGDGVRVIDVWESEARFHAFRESRLGAAIGQVLGDTGPQRIDVMETHTVVKP